MHGFCLGVIIASLLSLFLPAQPVFFPIIILIITIILLLVRQFFAVGICCFLLSWHLQLYEYRVAQHQLLAIAEQSFNVEVITFNLQQDAVLLRARLLDGSAAGYYVQLRWSSAPKVLAPGDIWRLTIRLKPPQTRLTPSGADQTLQALLVKELAQGYVVTTIPSIQLRQGKNQRKQWLANLKPYWQEYRSAPVLQALTFGERDFDALLWQGLRYSGLGHLLVISGLHISLVYGWSLVLLKSLQFLGWRLQINTMLLLALIPAFGYAWLAGFAAPTLRATATLALLVFARILLRPLAGWQYWLAICAALLLINPFWVLHFSFWLSIIAVGLILLLLWRQGPIPARFWAKVRYLFQFQLLLSILMAGVSLVFFNGFSSLALLSNFIFVPWCTLVAIPVLLVVLCYSLLGLPKAELGWQLADGLFLPLMLYLQWSAEQSVWWSQSEISRLNLIILASVLLILLLLRFNSIKLWCITFSCILLVVMTKPVRPYLVLLDAGQRTVLLINGLQHSLLYLDIPLHQTEATIQNQVLPLLRHYNISQLSAVIWPDYQVEMHNGWQRLQDAVGPSHFYSGAGEGAQHLLCQQILKYDDLAVTHYPVSEQDPCLLSVTLQGWRLLLPGLLRLEAERELVERYPELAAELYLLANYGRQDANSLFFLQQISPALILVAAEGNGRFRYPVQAVRQRLALLNSQQLHSGEQGTIVLHFQPETIVIRTLKQQVRPRWLEKPLQ